MFALDVSDDENASGVIESEARCKLDDDFDGFALSETRVDLLLTFGIDGVIDKDFGKSGRFKFDANNELNLLLSRDLLIEIDGFGSFVVFLLAFEFDLLADDFDVLELDVVEVIVVVVIDKELLKRFCCRPIKGLFEALLVFVDVEFCFFKDSKYFFS